MVRCAITDSVHVSQDPASQRAYLLDSAQRWAIDRVDFIQLREKDLDAGALLPLAEEMLHILRSRPHPQSAPTKLLINSRADIAIAARADGVHLTSNPDELTPTHIRRLFAHAGLPEPTVSISCHTLDDVHRASDTRANYILFGPVFEKRSSGGQLLTPGSGLDLLAEACQAAAPVPVLALGGITAANTAFCLSAGAAGIGAIRLFR